MDHVSKEIKDWQAPDSVDQWIEVVRDRVFDLSEEQLSPTNVSTTLADIMRYYKNDYALILFETERIFIDSADGYNYIESRICYARDLSDIGISEDDAWIFRDRRILLEITSNMVIIRFVTAAEITGSIKNIGLSLMDKSVKRLKRHFEERLEICENQNRKLEAAVLQLVQQRIQDINEKKEEEKVKRRKQKEAKKKQAKSNVGKKKKKKKKKEYSKSLF